jgi:hypothetical protein
MIDSWSLEALISRFELHPDFQEVYVEGETDVGFFQWFLEVNGRADIVVYPISAISIPDSVRDLFEDCELDRGSNRTSVILLALILEREIAAAASRVTCVADADTQHIQPIEFISSFLLFTDYTSLEMYTYRSDFITKLIRMRSSRLALSGESVMGEMTGILEELFSFRVANHQLRWGLKWIYPGKEYSFTRGALSFDASAYVKKYLNTNKKMARENEFWAVARSLMDGFGSNHKLQIRGHDYIELLTWYLKKRAYRAFQAFSEDTVRHSLLCQLQVGDMLSEVIFETLLAKYPALDPAI